MKITDTEIRDNRPTVTARPPNAGARRLAREGSVDVILARVTENNATRRGWWDLDDLMRAVCSTPRIVFFDNWNIVALDDAPRLVAAFDAVHRLDRLEFMEVAA